MSTLAYADPIVMGVRTVSAKCLADNQAVVPASSQLMLRRPTTLDIEIIGATPTGTVTTAKEPAGTVAV